MTEYAYIENQNLDAILDQLLRLESIPDETRAELIDALRAEIEAAAVDRQVIAAQIGREEDAIDRLQDQINELQDQIADGFKAIADMREQAERVEQNAQQLAQKLDLLQGVPSAEAYQRAYERIKAGERPRAVRAEFQKQFDVSNDSFRAAMYRRRQWEQQDEKPKT